jgi:hypothetical protein
LSRFDDEKATDDTRKTPSKVTAAVTTYAVRKAGSDNGGKEETQ